MYKAKKKGGRVWLEKSNTLFPPKGPWQLSYSDRHLLRIYTITYHQLLIYRETVTALPLAPFLSSLIPLCYLL